MDITIASGCGVGNKHGSSKPTKRRVVPAHRRQSRISMVNPNLYSRLLRSRPFATSRQSTRTTGRSCAARRSSTGLACRRPTCICFPVIIGPVQMPSSGLLYFVTSPSYALSPSSFGADLAVGVEADETLLPTSAANKNPDVLVAFMERAAKGFAERGLRDANWAFLLARLVEARASAMVHARPGAQRVQVDALWGFPDGLLHYPHDSWFYDPESGRATERRRYKGHCWLPSDNTWAASEVGRTTRLDSRALQ